MAKAKSCTPPNNCSGVLLRKSGGLKGPADALRINCNSPWLAFLIQTFVSRSKNSNVATQNTLQFRYSFFGKTLGFPFSHTLSIFSLLIRHGLPLFAVRMSSSS